MTTQPAAQTTITVHPESEIGRIDENVYGQFLESAFFGNIEGGVFDEGSALAHDGPGARAGLRTDVIELCRELAVPVVRWPGGNFTSPYHWEDGIGPRADRPRRLELAWGSEETNRFGTDEFLAWCAEVGTEAYLAHSCRDVDDAVRWVEYTSYAGDTDYTRRRAANGHPDPYRVRYWGIGNEVYGGWQMGHRDAETYARDAREHAAFMRQVDPQIKTIGVGQPEDEDWNRRLLQHAGRELDYLSVHLYGASTHLVTGDDYDAVVAQPVFFETQLAEFSEQVTDAAARAGVDRPLGLALDEWNVRHLEPVSWPAPQAGADGGIAPREIDPISSADTPGRMRVNRWSPRTTADALCYAGVINALHRLSGLPVPVTMANPVNLVNANGLIVARPTGAVRSTIFHVWSLYRHHTGPIAVRADVDGPARSAGVRQGHRYAADGAFATRPATVADLDVSATLTSDRRTLSLAVINRHRDRPARVLITTPDRDALPPRARIRQLGADSVDLNVGNDLSDPDRIGSRDLGEVELIDGAYEFPPHSLTVLQIAL